MKKVFFIVDCSGSIAVDDILKIGQINDLLRDSVTMCISKNTSDISVICYSDKAKVYWKSSDSNIFYDIPESRFGGRSNLGQAYDCIKGLIDEEEFKAKKKQILGI